MLQRTCDKCGKNYFLNSREIPRIIIRQKIDLNDLTSKDMYANPDFCEHCTNLILDFLQSKNKLRFSVSNYQKNNYSLAKEELRLINK